jgi:hypothetical protein
MVQSGDERTDRCRLGISFVHDLDPCAGNRSRRGWVWLQGDYSRWYTYSGWSVELARSLTPRVTVAAEAGGNFYSTDYSNGWSESHRRYFPLSRLGLSGVYRW